MLIRTDMIQYPRYAMLGEVLLDPVDFPCEFVICILRFCSALRLRTSCTSQRHTSLTHGNRYELLVDSR